MASGKSPWSVVLIILGVLLIGALLVGGWIRGVYNDATKEFGRSNVFERFEMVGDNVVKVVFFDRLQQLFPLSDGGCSGKLTMIQQLIDSNEGLLQAFDYLELDKIIGTSLSQSKFKSDVMEALFGELQTYLWAVPQQWNSPVEYAPLNAAAGPEMRYVEAVVRHVLLELTDVILMFAVESSVVRAAKVVQREYRGSPHPKPLPGEARARAALLSSSANHRGSSLSSAAALLAASAAAAEADLLMLSHGKYDMRPYLCVDAHPRLAFPSSSSSSSYSSSAGFDSAFGASSSSSRSSCDGLGGGGTAEIGVNVLRPLAHRLAEEADMKRRREASWKLAAPLLSAALCDNAEMAVIDFTARCVDAAPPGGSQRRVREQHIDAFVRDSFQQDECAVAGFLNAPASHQAPALHQLAAEPISSVEVVLAPSGASGRRRHASIVGFWWRAQCASCEWRPLVPTLLPASLRPAALPTEPPLEAAVGHAHALQQQQPQDDGDGDGDMATAAAAASSPSPRAREDDFDVAAAVHRACARDVDAEFWSEAHVALAEAAKEEAEDGGEGHVHQHHHRHGIAGGGDDAARVSWHEWRASATDAHDFTLVSLRPLVGKPRWGDLAGDAVRGPALCSSPTPRGGGSPMTTVAAIR